MQKHAAGLADRDSSHVRAHTMKLLDGRGYVHTKLNTRTTLFLTNTTTRRYRNKPAQNLLLAYVHCLCEKSRKHRRQHEMESVTVLNEIK